MLKLYRPPNFYRSLGLDDENPNRRDELGGVIKVRTTKLVLIGICSALFYLFTLLVLGVLGSPFAPQTLVVKPKGNDSGGSVDLFDRAIMSIDYHELNQPNQIHISITPLALPHTHEYMSVYSSDMSCPDLSYGKLLAFSQVLPLAARLADGCSAVPGLVSNEAMIHDSGDGEDSTPPPTPSPTMQIASSVVKSNNEAMFAVIASSNLEYFSITHPAGSHSSQENRFTLPFSHPLGEDFFLGVGWYRQVLQGDSYDCGYAAFDSDNDNTYLIKGWKHGHVSTNTSGSFPDNQEINSTHYIAPIEDLKSMRLYTPDYSSTKTFRSITALPSSAVQGASGPVYPSMWFNLLDDDISNVPADIVDPYLGMRSHYVPVRLSDDSQDIGAYKVKAVDLAVGSIISPHDAEPSTLLVGITHNLRFQFREASTRSGIADIVPYLGSYAHVYVGSPNAKWISHFECTLHKDEIDDESLKHDGNSRRLGAETEGDGRRETRAVYLGSEIECPVTLPIEGKYELIGQVMRSNGEMIPFSFSVVGA